MNIKDPVIELEKSEYLKERQRLWQLYDTPIISQARINLGEELAQIIFQHCEKALEKEFGLVPPLEGPGDVLWSSPSDLLLGKLALKPPYTAKCLQALTHECILNIGYDVENKFRREMELEMQRALEKQKIELEKDLEDQMRFEIKDVEIRERFNYQLKIEKLMQEFEQILVEELGKLENRLRSEYELAVNAHEELLKEKWQKHLDKEVEDTIEVMSCIFFDKLQDQEEVLSRNFKFELRKREIQKNIDVKLEHQKFKEALKHLRHSLECRNIANMMYVLCMERRKCCEEKTAIEGHYKFEIQKLQETIDVKCEEVRDLKAEKQEALSDVKLRELCLLKIIKQYQKFINFALRAAPTQAEFLLSIEKMMVFELNEAARKSDFPFIGSTENLIPWPHEEPRCPSEVSAGLEPDDFHNCYKILNPPIPDDGSQFGEGFYLPAVYYKNKLYMREDFRNMMSQGLEITPSNELWNKDVELLLETMRSGTSVHRLESGAGESGKTRGSDGSAESEERFVEIKPFDKRQEQKRISQTVEFDKTTPRHGSIMGKVPKASKKSSKESLTAGSLKPVLDQPGIDYAKVGATERHKSIISTRDSLEILRRKSGSKRPTLVEKYTNENEDPTRNMSLDNTRLAEIVIVEKGQIESQPPPIAAPHNGNTVSDELAETKDSIILRRGSLLKKSTEFSASPRDSIELVRDSRLDVKKKPSKLTEARNSVELLRESVLRVREPMPECPKKVTTSSASLTKKEVCCEKCYRPKGSTEKTVKSKASNEVEVVDGIIKDILSFRDSEHDRCVKMSHIEVYHVDEETKNLSNVMFVTPPFVYMERNEEEAVVGKASLERKPPKRRGKKKAQTPMKLSQQQHVIGNLDSAEGSQPLDEFTVERIHSFVQLIKDHPKLIQMFTAGLR